MKFRIVNLIIYNECRILDNACGGKMSILNNQNFVAFFEKYLFQMIAIFGNFGG